VPSHVKVVLLLVSMDALPTAQALEAVKPDVVQFHGAETPEWLALIKNNTPLEVWKAIGVRNAEALASSLKWKGAADKLLYDAAAGALPGGNGLALDWALLTNFRHELPWGLAGGLTPGNVADAIRTTGAPLVDASSGLESAPGVKDVDLIRAFCEAARNA
jgi:phosphoribosylanthranilate isomerase